MQLKLLTLISNANGDRTNVSTKAEAIRIL